MNAASPVPPALQCYWTGIPLWKRIFAALLLGVAAGLVFGPAMQALGWMGRSSSG